MNENNNELENNEDEELLEESQTRDSSKMVFIFLGVLTAIIASSVFYFLLKNKKPPIEIKTIERNEVKEKKFIEVPKEKIKPTPKEIKPTLPTLPKEIKKIVQKIYIPKIIKGTGAKLSISQNSSIKSNEIKTKEIELNAPKKPSIKPYTGGISTVAGIHHYDPNLFLVRGTFIPCSMDVKLISMVGGQITCTIAEDIYSANGNVLLVEKGSTAVGTYKKTGLKNGMNRLYAIWEDIRTPNNIIISIGSGASDELGSAGMVGDVDNHWGMRVGGAILLSVIDDVLSATAANLNRTDSDSFTINNTTSGTSDMADIMLQQYINIPPTLYKHQGDLINIYVNKDVDFSKVYKLKR